MTDIICQVYDLGCPSPVTLKTLAAISVSTELWRSIVKEHRTENKKSPFFGIPTATFVKNGFKLDQSSDIPQTIKPLVEHYLNKLFSSMDQWLLLHFECAFTFLRHTSTDILHDFNDIVCDYDGSIHYVRTAERLVRCKRVDQYEKFMIACAYCFEDLVNEIWPRIRDTFNEWIEKVAQKCRPILSDFFRLPQLYYWMSRLGNHTYPYQIPNYHALPIDDFMLSYTKTEFRSSIEYFWNRATSERQLEVSSYQFCYAVNLNFFCRFLLQRFPTRDFDVDRNANFMYRLSIGNDEEFVLSIWAYYKYSINKDDFIRLIYIFLTEHDCFSNVEQLCCRIWTSSPNNLKRCALVKILEDESLFEKHKDDILKPKGTKFIISVLNDATMLQRNHFWYANWANFLHTTSCSDLHQIMETCFRNEIEIEKFNNDIISNYGHPSVLAEEYFKTGHLLELSNLVTMSCCDKQTSRTLKRLLLQDNFFCEDSPLRRESMCEPKSLHKFIYDAYSDDVQQGWDLVASSGSENQLLQYLKQADFTGVKRFVEYFQAAGLNVQQLKQNLADRLVELLVKDIPWEMDVDDIQKYLLWCLGSEEEVTRFKASIDDQEVFLWMGMVTDGTYQFGVPNNFESFLLWYYDSREKACEARRKFISILRNR